MLHFGLYVSRSDRIVVPDRAPRWARCPRTRTCSPRWSPRCRRTGATPRTGATRRTRRAPAAPRCPPRCTTSRAPCTSSRRPTSSTRCCTRYLNKEILIHRRVSDGQVSTAPGERRPVSRALSWYQIDRYAILLRPARSPPPDLEIAKTRLFLFVKR